MKMKNTTYPRMVKNLVKSGDSILASLTPEKCHLDHMAQGVAYEAGELGDAIKKHIMYSKPLDRENVIEELGDMEFYMEGLRQGLNITREETLEANTKKLLGGRYKTGAYSDDQAIARADKEDAQKAP